MNALRVAIIVLALAILAGCAGVERKCIEDAVKHNQEKSENLEKMHTEARVTDSCEKVSFASEADYMSSNNGDFTYFRCDNADPIDDEDYAHLLDMHMRSLRIRIESCL